MLTPYSMIWHYSETFNSLDSFTTYCPNMYFNILSHHLHSLSSGCFPRSVKVML